MARAKAKLMLPAGHSLLFESIRIMRMHLRQLFPVAAIGTTLSLIFKNNEVLASLWFVFLSCALIWSIRHLEDPKVKITIRNAYYQGTAPVLRFILTLLMLSVASIPLSIGLLLYRSLIGITINGFMQAEFILISVVSLLLAVLSFYLLVRMLYALVIITLPDMIPLQAVRISWRLSQGKTMRLLRIWLIFVLYAAFVAGLLLVLITLSNQPLLRGYLFDFVIGLLIIPLFYTFMFISYKKLA